MTKGVSDMVLKLNTETHEVKECYEEYEKDLSREERDKLEVELASVFVLALAIRAKSMYKSVFIQKLYIDSIAKYAKKLLDPEDDSSVKEDVLAQVHDILQTVDVKG